MQLSTIPGDAYYYLLSLFKKIKNKSRASTAGAGSRPSAARQHLVGQAKIAMSGVQNHVSARWALKMVFQLVAMLGRDLSWEDLLSTGSYPRLWITRAVTPLHRGKGIQKNSMLKVGPAQ